MNYELRTKNFAKSIFLGPPAATESGVLSLVSGVCALPRAQIRARVLRNQTRKLQRSESPERSRRISLESGVWSLRAVARKFAQGGTSITAQNAPISCNFCKFFEIFTNFCKFFTFFCIFFTQLARLMRSFISPALPILPKMVSVSNQIITA